MDARAMDTTVRHNGHSNERREAVHVWAQRTLADLCDRQFYGKVTLHIEAGVVLRIVKEESVLPPPLPNLA